MNDSNECKKCITLYLNELLKNGDRIVSISSGRQFQSAIALSLVLNIFFIRMYFIRRSRLKFTKL